MSSDATQEHIRKMANSIHENGTVSFPPITICKDGDKVYVVAGYCRRRAFILARQEGAPIKGILAIANTQKEEDRTLDLLNSNDGLPLTQIEKARVIERLQKFGWSTQEIARKRGVSEQSIRQLLAVLELPIDVQEMVSKGEVSATLAVTKSPGIIREASEKKNVQKKIFGVRKNKITKKDLIKLNIFRPDGSDHPAMSKVYLEIGKMEFGERKEEALRRAVSLEKILW